MGTKGWIVFAIITVAALGGLVFMSNQGKVDVSDVDITTIIAASEKNGNIGDHVLGKKDAKVVLYEYGDFQCSGCSAAHARVVRMMDKYGDHMAFVFRNLPLSSMHPNARAAAATAEAAGMQGKYWEMHNKLFEHQNEWSGASSSDRTTRFRSYAESLGLDINAFNEALASNAISQKIAFDQALFKVTGFTPSTPTFAMDGKQIDATIWGEDGPFENFLKDALKKAGVTLQES